MVRDDRRIKAPADVESGDKFHITGLGRGHEVCEDAVAYGFVERAFVTVGPDIEFERFQLDAGLIRDIREAKFREIRLPGLWAQTGEFGDANGYLVVPLRMGVIKDLKLFGRFGRHFRL